jgi:hypothetical protein
LMARIVARPRPSRVIVSGGSGAGEPSMTRAGDSVCCANIGATKLPLTKSNSALNRTKVLRIA